jgi:hypothetical protein
MSKAIDNLTAAMKAAQAIRPRVGGFPYLAEVLRKAGGKAQRLVASIWPEPIPDSRGACRHAGATLGNGCRRRASFRRTGAHQGFAHRPGR